MAYDFKYVPTEGPISGISALEQTEIAINELGGFIENADSSAEEALEAAQNAQSTANDALNVAQDAITQVQEAKDDAAAASQAAQEATAAAGEASTKADTALDAAANAQTTADSATTTANNAQATANEATTTAEEADTKADQALATANSITTLIGETQQLATKALGAYTSDDTTVDADTLYTDADKRYLTNTGVTNFPIPAPFYFDVMVNSDNTSVCQKVWSANDTAPKVIYIRLGTVAEDAETFALSVTWGAWEQTGGGGSGDGEPEYVTNTENIDADTFFSQPTRIYSPSGVAASNFPVGPPFFFDTNVNTTGDRAFQRAWTAQPYTNGFHDIGVYQRTASIASGTPTWEPWTLPGAASDIFTTQSGAVDADSFTSYPVKMMLDGSAVLTNFPDVVTSSTATAFTPWFFESYTCTDGETIFQRLTQPYPGGAADPSNVAGLMYTRSRMQTDSSGDTQYLWGPWLSSRSVQRFSVLDRRTLGTAGGGASQGGFLRQLNYIEENTLPGAALANSNAVVPPGTYTVNGWVVGYGTGGCSVALRTGSTTVAAATSAGYTEAAPQPASSYLVTFTVPTLTVTARQAFFLFQYASNTKADNGAGIPMGWPAQLYEYYARLEFVRIA